MAIHHASKGTKILGMDVYVVIPFIAWGPIQTDWMFGIAIISTVILGYASYKRITLSSLTRSVRTLFIENYRHIRSPYRSF